MPREKLHASVTIRLSGELKSKLERYARRDDLTVSEYARAAVVVALEEQEQTEEFCAPETRHGLLAVER